MFSIRTRRKASQKSGVPRRWTAARFGELRGATMVEMAIVIPIFLLCVYATILLSLYYFVQSAVTKGAESGLQVAKVIDGIDLDTRAISMPTSPVEAAEIQNKYIDALRIVLDTAEEMPLRSILTPNSASPSHPFRLIRWDISLPNGTSEWHDSVLIRPGETFTDDRPFGDPSVTVEHPTCPASNVACGLSIAGQRHWDTIMRNHPLEVRVAALFQFGVHIPGIQPRIYVIGRALGFREFANRPSRGNPPTTTTTTVTTTTVTSTTATATSTTLTTTTLTTTTRTTTTRTTTSGTSTSGTTSTVTTTSTGTTTTGTTTTLTTTTVTSTTTRTVTTGTTTTATMTTTRTTTTQTTTTITGTSTTATSTTATTTTVPMCPPVTCNGGAPQGIPDCCCDCGENPSCLSSPVNGPMC